MESMNYTYEEVEFSLGTYWDILDKNGEYFASTKSEESAAIIVSALNGVAV